MVANLNIFKADTDHNTVSVETNERFQSLKTDERHLQSKIDRANPQRIVMTNLQHLMGILIFIAPPRKICLLGVGGGSLIHFLRYHYPESSITAVEIDAELLDIMHRKMALPKADDRLTYIIDDAAHFIEHNRDRFDFVIVDLFLGDLSPGWLLPITAAQRLYTMLNDGGGLAYNLVIDDEDDFNQFYASLRSVFHQQTLCLPVEALDNTIAFAFRQSQFPCDMTTYMAKATELGEFQDINYMEILSVIYRTNPTGSGVI